MEGHLDVLGVEVGKHLRTVTEVLALRTVCREWKDVVTLKVPCAELDLDPRLHEGSSKGQEVALKRETFVKLCPGIDELTYHISPQVTFDKFRVDLIELSRRFLCLRKLVLCFNNRQQQLTEGQLAVISTLKQLESLSLQANVDPDCSFSVLGSLHNLEELRVLPSAVSTGLNDGHVQSISALKNLKVLEFPGHTRCFTGFTLAALSGLQHLHMLSITSYMCPKSQTVSYLLCSEALACIKQLLESRRDTPMSLELGVPLLSWAAEILSAKCATGLEKLKICVREPATNTQVERLGDLENVGKLVGLDLQFQASPSLASAEALAKLTGLERLHLTSKCSSRGTTAFDTTVWRQLHSLRHFHLQVNPGSRNSLRGSTLASLAASWPCLEHLHLRLGSRDMAGLSELHRFHNLRYMSLQWLDAPIAGSVDFRHLPTTLETLELTSIGAVKVVVPASHGLKSPMLKTLTLDGNFGLSDDMLGRICSVYSGLVSLSLMVMGRQLLTKKGVAEVSRLSQLTHLLLQDYRENGLDQSCVEGFSRLKKLRSLRLSTQDLVHHDLRPEMYRSLSNLRRLELKGCQVDAAAVLGADLPLCCFHNTLSWATSA